MKKADVINLMSEKSGLSKADSERAIKAFFEVLAYGLREHGKVVLVKCLSAERIQRKATTASNPKTREKVTVPAKMVVKLRPGKMLLDAVK